MEKLYLINLEKYAFKSILKNQLLLRELLLKESHYIFVQRTPNRTKLDILMREKPLK